MNNETFVKNVQELVSTFRHGFLKKHKIVLMRETFLDMKKAHGFTHAEFHNLFKDVMEMEGFKATDIKTVMEYYEDHA